MLREKRAPENKKILLKIFEILAEPNHVHVADVVFIVTDKYFNLLDLGLGISHLELTTNI